MNQNLGVVIILVNTLRKSEVLIGERKNSYKAGFFGLPGGRIESFESLRDAAVRELQEETSVIARDVQLFGAVKEAQRELSQDFVHFVCVCTRWDGEVVNREPDKCVGWQWVEVKELPANMITGHQAALELWLRHHSNPDASAIADL